MAQRHISLSGMGVKRRGSRKKFARIAYIVYPTTSLALFTELFYLLHNELWEGVFRTFITRPPNFVFLRSRLATKKRTHSARRYYWGPTLSKVHIILLLRHEQMCFRYIAKGRWSKPSTEVACKEASSNRYKRRRWAKAVGRGIVNTSGAKWRRRRSLRGCLVFRYWFLVPPFYSILAPKFLNTETKNSIFRIWQFRD
jgi:hypothetical protein